MQKQVRSGLKWTFLLHFIVALFFGLILLFVPEWWGNLTNWPVGDVAMYRLVGAAMLGYGTSSILAYRETNWEKVILVVRMEIVWTGLATLVFLWALLFADAPAIGWLYAALMAVWCAAFSIFYNPA